MSHPLSPFRVAALVAFAVAASLSSGCAVATVAGTAAGLAVSGVGLAADAAIGTVRLTGKAVGAMLPGDEAAP